MLAESGDSERGFNSAALTIADALGGATTIAASGAVFATVQRTAGDPFVAALAVGCCAGLLAVVTSARTNAVNHPIDTTVQAQIPHQHVPGSSVGLRVGVALAPTNKSATGELTTGCIRPPRLPESGRATGHAASRATRMVRHSAA